MKQKTLKKIAAVVLIIIVIAIGVYLFFINKAVILKHYSALETFIHDTGFFGAFVFVLITITKTLFPAFPTEPFELISGAVYGALLGGLLCHLGVLIGGLIVYFLGKKLNGYLTRKLDGSELKQKVEKLKKGKSFNKVCCILFFLPGTPKEILMIILCTMGIDFKRYLFYITVLRIPSIFSSTIAGALAGNGQFVIAAIIYALTLLVTLGGYYYENKVMNR